MARPVYLQGQINPNYDTIFLKKDSSLYNGYVKMISEEIRDQNDTIKFGFSIYRVTNGIPNLTYSSSYGYRHPKTYSRFYWEAYETTVSDSNKVSLSYYPNGLKKTERIYRYMENDTVYLFKKYDSTGVVLQQNKRVNNALEGSFFFRINDSLSLELNFEKGVIKSILTEEALFFDHRKNTITEKTFVSRLESYSKLNWGFLVVDNSIALYLTQAEVLPYITMESRGLSGQRKRGIKQRVRKRQN